MKKKFLAIGLVIIALAMMLCACGTEYTGYLDSESSSDALEKSVLSGETVDSSEFKYVITSELKIESKDITNDVEKITGWVSELGGYIEYLNENMPTYEGATQTCTMKVRIPVSTLDRFKANIEEAVNVISKTENKENITDSYYEAESYYTSLKVQEERLLAILEQATELEDILAVESSLAEVRQKISYYDTLIKTYDNQVEYATMNITVEAVDTYTNVESFGSRFGKAFVESWTQFWVGCKDFVIWLVSAIPTLLVLGVIALGIYLIVRGIIKKAKKNRKKK